MGPDGGVYAAGYFDGTADFDPGVGTHPLTSAGGNDVFVSNWTHRETSCGPAAWGDQRVMEPVPSAWESAAAFRDGRLRRIGRL